MHTLLGKVIAVLFAPSVFFAGIAGYHVLTNAEFAQIQQNIGVSQLTVPSQLFGAFNPTGGKTYRLSSSISSTQTTITLSSFKEPISNIPYTMSYLNSSVEYGTLDPQSNTSDEFIAFTGITQNADGTATLSGVSRGLSRTPAGNGCVASSTLAQPHSGQSIFILSDSPCLFNEYYVLRNNATSTGVLVFSSTTPPRYDLDQGASFWTTAASSTLVDLAQLQRIALAGTVNASTIIQGLVQLATSRQAASSTGAGSTGALDVLQSSYATDTPQNCSTASTGGCVVMSLLNGKLNQLWLDLTQAFSFSGTVTFSGTASTTVANGFYANQIAAPYFIATSTATTTLRNVLMSSATTTGNFGIGGVCTNCLNGYEIDINSGAGPTAAGNNVSLTVTCSSTKKVIGGGANDNVSVGSLFVNQSYPSASNVWTINIGCDAAVASCTANTMTAYAICVNP